MAVTKIQNTELSTNLKFKFFAALVELQKYSPEDTVNSAGQEYSIDEMLSYLEKELS
jgi:hypothetical protein|tara:strand:- start:100 stop:270 length:171 start_codon:yes stop_codon:yes gene_type:complete